MSELRRAEMFRIGEVWLSPKSYYYKVVEINGTQAVMKMGMDASGRKIRRDKYKVIGWTLFSDNGESY